MKELVVIATCWSTLAELSGASAHVVRITLCSALCVAIREIATRGWRRLWRDTDSDGVERTRLSR